MPEFENTEPFFDRSSKNGALPVAPHSSEVTDYTPDRRRARNRSGFSSSKGLQPIQVDSVQSVSASEMEKAYRKADRTIRDRQRNSGRRKPSGFSRLIEKLFSWLKRPANKTDAKPESSKPSRNRNRPGKRPSNQSKGGPKNPPPGDRRQGKHSADNQSSAQEGGGGRRRSRGNRNRQSRGASGERSPDKGNAPKPNSQANAQSPAPQKASTGEQEASAPKRRNRSSRNRNRRNRPNKPQDKNREGSE